MTRAEFAGWLQVAIGAIGLYFTMRSGGPALDAIAQVGAGEGLPADFVGAQGVIRVFLFLLALSIALTLLLIGLGLVLAAVFRRMGSNLPHHSSFALIAALVLLCLTGSFGILGAPIWPGLALLTLVLFIVAGIAGVDEDGGGLFWILLIVGTGGSVVVGLIVAIAMTSSPPRADEVGSEATETVPAPPPPPT